MNALMSNRMIGLADAGDVVRRLSAVIAENAPLLSEVDGATGDGDHGINMNKGFSQAAEALGSSPIGFEAALRTLGRTLLDRIGGSMGPLYGSFFIDMADQLGGRETLDAAGFAAMLDAGIAAVTELGGARPGDKTLVDVLVPAGAAFHRALDNGEPFAACLAAMAAAAERGKENTRMLVARIGRASRLGERSRGTLDAGAVSCWLILDAMAADLRDRLDGQNSKETVR